MITASSLDLLMQCKGMANAFRMKIAILAVVLGACIGSGICLGDVDDSSGEEQEDRSANRQTSVTQVDQDNVMYLDEYTASSADLAGQAQGLFQLEDLLFQAAPSALDKQAAIEGLQVLHAELIKALSPVSPKRSWMQASQQENAEQQVEEEADVAELVDTAALSSAADAAFMLAVLAATGIAAPHVPMNDSWAVKTLHAAAQGGSPEANLALAHRYFTADGVPGSCQEGLRRARSVADEYVASAEGSTPPELPLEPISLRLRHRHGSYDSLPIEDSWAQDQLEAELLDFGDVFQRILGYRQLFGQDMEADPAAAFQQFQEAALQGDAYAVFNLGYMHMKGIGTQPNATTAQQNFEIAAKHGIPAAYNGLGVLHFEGHAGSTIDYSAARQAFMNGAALGDPDSMFNLATIYAGGHGVPLNHTLAHRHYLDAHDAGHWRAPHALAITHQRGWGVKANCTKAQHYIQTFIRERSSWTDQMDEAILAVDAGSEWLAVLKYATVAVQGSAVAQANLAWLLERSSEYEAQQRVQMCMRLLSQAGKGGLPDAWVDAGNLKYYTPQKEAAASLYRLAAEAGSIEGMYSLGWVHAAGKGLPRNRTQAAALYKLAIQKAPDWRHAAPPFIALLLLPGLVALQWVQILSPALTSFEIAGWKRALPQLQLSWDTWVLTAAAASLSWVMWRRHKRLLQMQHTSHTRGNSETGVG